MNTSANNRLQERLNAARAEQNNFNYSARNAEPIVPEEDIEKIANQISSQTTSEEIVSENDHNVELVDEVKIENTAPQIDDPIYNLNKIQEDSAKLADELSAKQSVYESNIQMKNPSELTDVDAEVESIIGEIENLGSGEDSTELDIDENASAEEILKKFEESKIFAEYTEVNDHRGPAGFVIENNDEYTSQLDHVMELNNIKFDKVSGSDKNALLNRFTNSGTTVTVPLPNSGIYVKMSGAGVDELIAMASITGDTPMHQEIEKLTFIGNHIVDTSVGPLKLLDLLGIISYYDIPTLYYALFAATHPDEVEVSRVCPDCGKVYYMNINTRDLLLNYKDFEKTEGDIRDNVLTYKQLLEKSQLSKIYRKLMSNNMLIYYKHPSIKSFLNTYNHMDKGILKRYPSIVPLAFSIDKIAIQDTRPGKSGDRYVEYSNPNEVITIISRLKNINEKYEINETIESIRPSVSPAYGYHDATCPHCGTLNKEEAVAIDSLLFTIARDEDTIAGLRSQAREEKRKKSDSQMKG